MDAVGIPDAGVSPHVDPSQRVGDAILEEEVPAPTVPDIPNASGSPPVDGPRGGGDALVEGEAPGPSSEDVQDAGELPHLDGPQRGGVAPAEETAGPSTAGSANSVGVDGNGVEVLEALAKSISSTLGPVIRDFDSRAESVATSQDGLCISLDRLTAELDKLLEDAPLPFIMQHAAKISAVRKRVRALNSFLSSIQCRIDKIDQLISIRSAYGTETKHSHFPGKSS